MKKCKWCQCITCNKKATNWTDKTITLRNGEVQTLGYCYGHYEMIVTKTRYK